jgi:hypothetical protein
MGRPKKYHTDEERKAALAAQHRSHSAKFSINNPEYTKNQKLKQAFGITLDDYNQMLFKQNGKCAICNIHHTEFKRALSVDHCHITGKIRGLLCDNCNHILGKAKDNITILKQSIKYLTHYGIRI